MDLHGALRRYWGYDSFRPKQENIVNSLLAGHDVAVVMPTGGGKSLCYQLPALVLGRTVIVISPLIALMQDQAAQLAQMGVPAAVLNSARPPREQQEVMRNACEGAFACCIFHRSGWRARIRSAGCNACPLRSSPSTRRIAFPNGATSSVRNTGS